MAGVGAWPEMWAEVARCLGGEAEAAIAGKGAQESALAGETGGRQGSAAWQQATLSAGRRQASGVKAVCAGQVGVQQVSGVEAACVEEAGGWSGVG